MALGFESLECWKKARDLRKELKTLIITFPKEEKYQLVSQLTRASRSVTANIAEGSGRYYYLENVAFCRKSRGSLFEIKDHLIVAVEYDYMKENEFKEFEVKLEECIALLNGYILYLKKKKNE